MKDDADSFRALDNHAHDRIEVTNRDNTATFMILDAPEALQLADELYEGSRSVCTDPSL